MQANDNLPSNELAEEQDALKQIIDQCEKLKALLEDAQRLAEHVIAREKLAHIMRNGTEH